MLPISCSALPADGIILRPSPKDHDGTEGEAGLGGGVTSTIMGGASIHDESFEDEFSDMEGSFTDGHQGTCTYDGNNGRISTMSCVCVHMYT